MSYSTRSGYLKVNGVKKLDRLDKGTATSNGLLVSQLSHEAVVGCRQYDKTWLLICRGLGGNVSDPGAGEFHVRNPIPMKVHRVWGPLHAKLYVVVKRSLPGEVRKLGEEGAVLII
ncbi:hypothetical protein AVEN_93806-1 [Araneus ventricosus]|uniref:Uncharacterized protein n=1 Tax=Araneus ventricosus TaxID=182803 RepID=A0A4Y2AY92_ARAVE|nr:hypothetical protein AVEN_93806-1 [Araneus ventricosus]